MKKPLLIAAGSAVALVVVVVGIVTIGSDTASSPTASTKQSSSQKSPANKEVHACDILTQALATEIAGVSVSGDQTDDVKSESINVSNCSYVDDMGKTGIGLFARSPLDSDGADNNKDQFGSALPKGVEKVSGYGDAAYWDPSLGGFNILKNDVWYILTKGNALRPDQNTLADAKAYADKIIDKL